MSFPDGVRLSDSIASKIIEGGVPSDLDGLRFNAALNIWEFVPFGGGGTGLWTVLGDYEAAIAEASHVFSFAAVDFDDDSLLMLVFDGSLTASASILMRINADATANYFIDGYRISSSVQTLIDINTSTSMELVNSTLTAGDQTIKGVVTIQLSNGALIDRPVINSHFHPLTQEQVIGAILNIDSASITDVEVLLSGSTWQIGTRMTLYKLARA